MLTTGPPRWRRASARPTRARAGLKACATSPDISELRVQVQREDPWPADGSRRSRRTCATRRGCSAGARGRHRWHCCRSRWASGRRRPSSASCMRSVINPYPYAKPDEIWAPAVRASSGRGGHTYSLDEFLAMRRMPAFADVMATTLDNVLLTGDFAPETLTGVRLTGNAFGFLGVPALVGRVLQPSDVRRRRGSRAGGRAQLQAVAADLRRRHRRHRRYAAVERSPAHDRRRHAAALRLVHQ